jgi:hypothetical protein
MDVLAQMRSHLELLGYEASLDEHMTIVSRSDKPVFGFFEYRDGVLFMCSFDVQQKAFEDTPREFLEFVNSANVGSKISRFYWEGGSPKAQLFVEAWFPNWYERKAFGLFIDTYFEDMGRPFLAFPDVARRFIS